MNLPPATWGPAKPWPARMVLSRWVLIVLLGLLAGCNKPHRMQAYAREKGVQANSELPVYIDLRFATTADAHDQLYAWFTKHGFRYVSSAYDPAGKRVVDSFAYQDLVESSLAEIGTQTWVMVYGILDNDQTLRTLLQELVHDVQNTRQAETIEVVLP